MPKVPPELIKDKYLLKSTFMFGKLGTLGFFSLFSDMKDYARQHGEKFRWDDRADWGINEDVWGSVIKAELDPLLLFAHPNVLRSVPQRLMYYRCIALLPQKGLQSIVSLTGLSSIEAGKANIPEGKLVAVIRALNETVTGILRLDSCIDEEKLRGMMYATAGTSIDGSWRNSIGEEGERVIRSLLLESLLDNKEVTAIVNKAGKTIPASAIVDKKASEFIHDVRSITTVNGSIVTFKSEPDIELSGANGRLLGGVEIKAGIDPAAALERLGAMIKSFENLLQTQPSAQTILVASCITDEVQERLNQSHSVQQIFVLHDVVSNARNRGDQFSNAIRSVLGLIGKRS